MIDKETQEVIRATIRLIVACPIPVRWLAQSVMPGGGERKSRMRGSNGYEVLSRVEYEPGDDPRDIDWSATAQTGGQTIIVKQDAEPREIDVYVLADLSATMSFGTARATKRMLAAELAGSVVKSAGKTQDRIGFIAFDERRMLVKRRPTGAARALYPVVATIISKRAESNDKSGSAGAINFGSSSTPQTSARALRNSGLLKSLADLPDRRSLVFILSDFLNLSQEDRIGLKRAAARHDIVCVIVQDLRERSLPDGRGLLRLIDLSTGNEQTIWLSDASRAAFAAKFAHHQATLLAHLKAAHCDTAVFSTEEGRDALQKVMALFGRHRR